MLNRLTELRSALAAIAKTVLLLALLTLSLQAKAHVWPEALEQFKIEEMSLYSIKITSTGRSVNFLVHGFLYSAVVGSHISEPFLMIRQIETDRIILGELNQDKNGDWIESLLEWRIDQRPVQLKTPINSRR